MKKKALITGVGSVLGSNLARNLLEDGYAVIGVDHFSSGKITNIKGLSDGQFICKEMNICSKRLLSDTDFLDVQEIYHIASFLDNQSDPFETIEVITVGTKNILELAKRLQASMVFASNLTAFEGSRRQRKNAGKKVYKESLQLGETLCQLYSLHFQTKVKVARISYPNQEHQDTDMETIMHLRELMAVLNTNVGTAHKNKKSF
ncbi:NAD-dependent epimerase/dehydratase family protein [Neobacillus sp. LXY-1]|uniref:NAD-dependent epimerase/dehydratase family protein n=1 Tax=Neobacillus sp. LXY-1 TaxID=3379133 RepID=UPI003EDF7476